MSQLKRQIELVTTHFGSNIEKVLAELHGRKVGYALILFESNGPTLSYRSTGRPESMAALLRELADKLLAGAGRVIQ
jgi:hypothetical protein